MYKYGLLNLLVALAALAAARLPRPFRRAGLVLAVMLVLTAVFDNVILALDIVRYTPGTWSGLALGRAPLEDFAYAVVAALVLPALWERGQPQ